MRALITMTWNPLVFVLLIVVDGITMGCPTVGAKVGHWGLHCCTAHYSFNHGPTDSRCTENPGLIAI
jgi:hypothetical protein